MLNKPATVPDIEADGIFKLIVGVEFALVTVDEMVFPLVVTVIGFTLVTVPPVPVAVNVFPVKVNPDPMVTSPGAAGVALILPNNLPPVIFCILA